MSKYRQLTSHLASLDRSPWAAEFKEIEGVLGFALPKSAYSWPAWWSNQSGQGHSQSMSWQSVGWRTGELDLANRRVTFFRDEHAYDGQRPRSSLSRMNRRAGLTIAEAKAGLSAYFGVPLESIEITIKG